jgi:dTMP kinase
MFIVIDGIDGPDTTSICRCLHERLLARGFDVVTTREPTGSAVGKLLKDILVEDSEELTSVSNYWTAMALLFTADRMVHVDQLIKPWLEQGKVVLCDRYYYSTVAYQLAMSKFSGAHEVTDVVEWIRRLNSKALSPALSIILDIPVARSRERIERRRLRLELTERENILAEAANAYSRMSVFFPDDNIINIDADRAFEEVALSVFEAVKSSGVVRGL